MRRQKEDLILHNHNHDGVDRRGFLKCMAWAGTGALFVVKGGVLRSYSLSDPAGLAAVPRTRARPVVRRPTAPTALHAVATTFTSPGERRVLEPASRSNTSARPG